MSHISRNSSRFLVSLGIGLAAGILLRLARPDWPSGAHRVIALALIFALYYALTALTKTMSGASTRHEDATPQVSEQPDVEQIPIEETPLEPVANVESVPPPPRLPPDAALDGAVRKADIVLTMAEKNANDKAEDAYYTTWRSFDPPVSYNAGVDMLGATCAARILFVVLPRMGGPSDFLGNLVACLALFRDEYASSHEDPDGFAASTFQGLAREWEALAAGLPPPQSAPANIPAQWFPDKEAELEAVLNRIQKEGRERHPLIFARELRNLLLRFLGRDDPWVARVAMACSMENVKWLRKEAAKEGPAGKEARRKLDEVLKSFADAGIFISFDEDGPAPSGA